MAPKALIPFSLRITPELYDAIKDYAKKHDISMSKAIHNVLVDNFIKMI